MSAIMPHPCRQPAGSIDLRAKGGLGFGSCPVLPTS